MKILVVAAANFDLYYLSSVAYLLKTKDNSLEFRLLLRRLFESNLTPEIRSLYSKIDFFELPAITPPLSKNPIKMTRNVLRDFSNYLKFRSYLKKNLPDIDTVFIYAFKEFFANILCRLAPKNIRLVVLKLADQKLKETDYLRRPILSWLLNVKNFLFGYSVMDYRFRIDSKNDLAFKDFVKYPYHKTIDITPAPFIALRKLYKSDKGNPAILIAAERTPPYKTWDKADHKKYEEFLNYLRENFKNYKLYFKPKQEKTDLTEFDLKGFEVLDPKASLEEFCLRKNIKKVISIKSTASRVGAYLGIPSYLLYPMFRLPKELSQLIENAFADMPSIIKVNRLEDLKKEPEPFIGKYDLDKLSSLYWEAIQFP